MNKINNKMAAAPISFLIAFLFLSAAALTASAEEEKFAVFQVGTQTYTNVTVTTKAKKYVFILHSTGMANIKVADLSPEQQKQLGYGSEDDSPGKLSRVKLADWTKQKVALLDTPSVRAAEKSVQETLQAHGATNLGSLKPADRKVLIGLAVAMLLSYLFHCYCHKLICEKAGKEPGVLIWLPILQIIPIFKAATMSLWWVLLGPIASIVWCFKIAKARGKSAGVGVLLLLPITNFFAFLYLAFSDGVEPKEQPSVQVMTLETA